MHAGGDASGAEVTRTLAGALRARGIEVLEHTVALDALRAADGRVVGLRVARIGDDGALVDAGDLRARAVVLATGGYGQVFAATSNPAGATGDGLALALRAGAEVADVEMVQFHPTVLWTGPGRRRPAGADLRGGARRGRRPRRRATDAGSWPAPTRWPTSPRATSSRPPSPPTCARPATTTSSSTPPTWAPTSSRRRFPASSAPAARPAST